MMNRGVNRSPIFNENYDRDYFLRLVTEYKESCDAKVYHWVLMIRRRNSAILRSVSPPGTSNEWGILENVPASFATL